MIFLCYVVKFVKMIEIYRMETWNAAKVPAGNRYKPRDKVAYANVQSTRRIV